MNRLAVIGVAFLAGYAYGRISAFRMPIDEYHEVRMRLEEQTGELNVEERET